MLYKLLLYRIEMIIKEYKLQNNFPFLFGHRWEVEEKQLQRHTKWRVEGEFIDLIVLLILTPHSWNTLRFVGLLPNCSTDIHLCYQHCYGGRLDALTILLLTNVDYQITAVKQGCSSSSRLKTAKFVIDRVDAKSL